MWLSGQVDYLLLLSGIAFLGVAVNAVSLHRTQPYVLAWRWLAVFAIVWALIDWAEMLGMRGAQTGWLVYAEFALATPAFVALLEFWRDGLKRQVGQSLSWMILPVAPALIVLALMAGLFEIAMAALYVLGLAASIAAAFTLYSLGRTLDAGRRVRAFGSAAALGAYGVFGVFSLAGGGSLGAGELNIAALTAWSGIPLELPRTIVVAAFSLLFASYAQRCSPLRTSQDGRRTMRLVSAITTVVMSLAIVLGWLYTNAVGEAERAAAREDIVSRAQLAAAAVEPRDIAALTATSADLSSAEFAAVQRKLTRLLETSADDMFLYLMAERDGAAVIVVEAVPYRFDSEPDDPGTVYEDASPELTAALSDPRPFVEGPLEDEWGVWYTAFIPLAPASSGRGPVLLGLDRDAAVVDRAVLAARRDAIVLIGVVAVLIIAVYSVARITRLWAVRIADAEQRFRAVFESAPEAIFIVDPGTMEIAVANPFMHEWLGYAQGSLVGVAVADITIGGEEAVESCMTSLWEGTPVSHACGYLRADGTAVDVELTAVNTDHDGRPGILAFARDTTERTRIEEAAAYRGRFNEVVVEISTGFVNALPERIDERVEHALELIGRFLGADRAYVWELAPGGDLLRGTHEWAALGALARHGELQNVPVTRFPTIIETLAAGHDLVVPDVVSTTHLFPAERDELVAEGIQSIAAVPMTWRGEFFGVLGFDTMSATAPWTDDAIALLRVAADAITGAIQRKRASAEVRRLSRALEQSPVAVAIANRDGSIRWVNQKFTAITGYTLSDVRGRDLSVIRADDTPEYLVREMEQAVAAGKDWTADVTNRRSDGTAYWASEVVSSIRDYEGHVTEIISVHEDVSTIKAAEHALIDAKRAAEEANRAKSEFLAAMSHEIRTPMNAIIGMAELLEETELTPQQWRYIEIFKAAGESLLTLINDVLDLSKIEAGRLEVEEMGFDAADLIERTAAVAGVKAREKGLELLYRVAPGTPTALRGDPDRLQQVLTNLLANAVKFTEEGEVVLTVETEPEMPLPGDDGRSPVWLRFSVADTGIGIPEEKRELVFESFRQADSSTTRKYGGTGLGLSISRRLVELMGGRIWLESKVGHGSVFRFVLPLKVATLAEGRQSEPVTDLSGKRILVVDDNPTNRLILREMLGGWGAMVDEAFDGVEGVDHLTRASTDGAGYDAVVLDNRMPNMDGVQFLEIVRSDPALSRTGVVMLSSESGTNLSERLRPLGLTDYLTKPVRRSDLHDALVVAASVTERAGGPVKVMAGGVAGAKPAEPVFDPERTLRILVVEDSEDNRFLVGAHLAKVPAAVEMAEHGAEAVAAFEAGGGAFDLVLMDMQMPGMDGYEATRRIRELEAAEGWGRTPVVALTAYALNDEVERSLAAGCDDHLTKPIKRRVLIEAVARHTGGA